VQCASQASWRLVRVYSSVGQDDHSKVKLRVEERVRMIYRYVSSTFDDHIIMCFGAKPTTILPWQAEAQERSILSACQRFQ
jgi:hypothetical protein